MSSSFLVCLTAALSLHKKSTLRALEVAVRRMSGVLIDVLALTPDPPLGVLFSLIPPLPLPSVFLTFSFFDAICYIKKRGSG
jgi:hypothetical protein